jgi:hypothetical protein
MFYPMFLRLSGYSVVWLSIRRPSRSKIWRDRVNAILRHLELSIEVVVCDADAIVVGDFTEDLNSIEGDLIISQGTGLPKVAFEAWGGFTLCCGFAVYRPEARTLSLMRKVSGYSEANHYDDQIALNSVLLDNKLVWGQPRTQYFIENGKRRIRCFSEELIGTVPEGDLKGLRVVMLPHSTYRRMPNSLELAEPKVFHPLPEVRKVARGVKQSLRDNGLWRLSGGKIERIK